MLLYDTILSQTISPCGNFLLAGNTTGSVAVFDLQKIVNPGDKFAAPVRKPEYHFKIGDGSAVCSMVTTDKFLVTGTCGEIQGWDWKSVISNKNPKQSWTIQIPSSRDTLEKTDVNCMFLLNGQLFAGCGDNKIYVFSLEDGQLVRTMEGHDDYIHCIDHSDTQIASASEDGTVKLWDLRQKACVNMLEPYLSEKVARADLGKWVGAVSINEDWLVCGGAPRLSLWHLRSLDVTTVFPIEDTGIHFATFCDDRIMAGGCNPHFYQLNYNGKVLAQIPSSSTTVYSAVFQESPLEVLSIAGSSSNIDFCTNFDYRDLILSFT